MTATRDLWSAHAPELDTSPMEIVALIKAVSAMFERALEPMLDGAPLSAPELDMLIVLRHDPEPMIARRLADTMRISRPAAGKTLTKLENRGYITRAPSRSDRRARVVTVTDAGKKIVDTFFPRQLAIEADLLSGLGADRDRVVEALDILVAAMQHRVGEPPY
ncbi:putative MarR-family transcriptional regulator [Gordonia polyisoprenivorans VH2]|uniref:Putative MarR-family transcriptional regulator n=1 Tax=Gordonia polyisoprenivorans (strain DSM 44266 / VH2) TaxID=1112204 RepID=H6MZ73_GORPV|nr:MarR family transcriptional regulator [Gordonia polyisoprenivorans]AFA74409.1 putative MarR-family transcriptional regulator [Gordonia polyisoprenivorans VH2]